MYISETYPSCRVSEPVLPLETFQRNPPRPSSRIFCTSSTLYYRFFPFSNRTNSCRNGVRGSDTAEALREWFKRRYLNVIETIACPSIYQTKVFYTNLYDLRKFSFLRKKCLPPFEPTNILLAPLKAHFSAALAAFTRLLAAKPLDTFTFVASLSGSCCSGSVGDCRGFMKHLAFPPPLAPIKSAIHEYTTSL